MFASWGAGEHGYMGSMEWIEEFQTILTDRTVAHLNVDLAVIHTFNMLGELYIRWHVMIQCIINMIIFL